MDEETTTDAPAETGGQTIHGVQVDDQGMAVPEPETEDQAEAGQETTEVEKSTEPEQQAEQTTGPSEEEEQLAKFAQSKGLELDSDSAKKAAKMAMEAEKRMHTATKRASELEKTTSITDEDLDPNASPEDRDNARIRNVELKMDIRQWKMDNPSKLQHEADMVKLLQDPVKKQLVQAGYLTLDDVYKMSVGDDTAAVKSQGGREALETLAQKQQAAVPRGNAVNGSVMSSGRITSQNVDQLVAQNDQKWFEAHYKEINEAMAG